MDPYKSIAVNKIFEKIIYAFGISGSFYNVRKELCLLQSNLPKEFINRDVLDIGCGDGKISLKLKEILHPTSFRGVDASRHLVRSAKKWGLSVTIFDVETQPLQGDLGIMWGVLHHFQSPSQTLKKLCKEFNSLIIRESIDDKRIFELGNKLNKNVLMNIINEAQLTPIKIVDIKENKSIILFIKNTH